MTRRRTTLFGLCVSALVAPILVRAEDATPAPASASVAPVAVGDPAPRLEPERWLKGEPIGDFQPGTVYVIEFWATWCGPCKDATPNLTWWQKKYPEVVFVGVSVMEEDGARVQPFVESMGDLMNYRVAADRSPGDAQDGPIVQAWMPPGGYGLPCTFIIDGNGRIADITSPRGVGPKLDRLLAGKPLQLERAAADSTRLWTQYRTQVAASAFDDAARTIETLLRDDPDRKAYFLRQLLVQRGDFAAAERAFAEIARRAAADEIEPFELFQSRLQQLDMSGRRGDAPALNRLTEELRQQCAGNARWLNSIAWHLIGTPRGEGNHLAGLDMDRVLAVAREADRAAGGNDPGILDTLARVHALRGEFELAIRTQEAAIALAKGKPLEQPFSETLARYRVHEVE